MIRTKEQARMALERKNDDKAFYFHNENGYLNIKANSLEEALDVIKNVDENSLIYHLSNNHFQKWISDVFGDATLSRRIDRIKINRIKNNKVREVDKLGTGKIYRGKPVREELLKVLEERLNWLKLKAGV